MLEEDGKDGERRMGKSALDACSRIVVPRNKKPSLGAGRLDGG